jgi:hypothetical protein
MCKKAKVVQAQVQAGSAVEQAINGILKPGVLLRCALASVTPAGKVDEEKLEGLLKEAFTDGTVTIALLKEEWNVAVEHIPGECDALDGQELDSQCFVLAERMKKVIDELACAGV